jgi:hypothetical protein
MTPAPHGLIFHMSRCGSTLLVRMLAADPANTVINEDPGIDKAALSGDPAALREAAAVLAGEGPLYLKLDCWAARELPLYRAAFPDTPWIFVHRDPVEVMVSHARRPGSQMVGELVDPARLGLAEVGNPLDPAYHAAVLTAVCEGALRHWDLGGGLVVDYRDLPDALFDWILPHFGATPDAEAVARMRAATRRNAKYPEQAFTPDTDDKRREAGAGILAACEGRLATAHARLRQLSEAVVS